MRGVPAILRAKARATAVSCALTCALGVAGGPLAAQQVDFTFRDTLAVRGTDLPYQLDLGLSAGTPTRINVDAVLDLREAQKILPQRLADNAIVDNCGVQVRLDNLSVAGVDVALHLDGGLSVTRFACDRTSESGFQRGAVRNTLTTNVSTQLSVEVRDNCAFLRVRDLTLAMPDTTREQRLEPETLDALKGLVLSAVELVLNETPLCPTLPEALRPLDPSYARGGLQEIGDGGVGIVLQGSVDSSPGTIIRILSVLQRQSMIPGPP